MVIIVITIQVSNLKAKERKLEFLTFFRKYTIPLNITIKYYGNACK